MHRKDSNIFFLLKCLYNHFSKRRKNQINLLLVLSVIGSVAEVISLSSIVPFIGVITDPGVVLYNPLFSSFFEDYNIDSPNQLVFLFSTVFIAAAIVAGTMRFILLWFSVKLVNAISTDIGICAYQKYLNQPFYVYASQNSSSTISGITQKIGIATSVLMSLVTSITSLMMLMFLLVTLLFIDKSIASIAIVGFGVVYAIIGIIVRKKLFYNSKCISKEQNNIVKVLQESLGAMRDILLDKLQAVFVDIYTKSIRSLKNANTSNSVISQSPRFLMETLGMVLVALLILFYASKKQDLTLVLPVLAALALGAQKMLPLLQQVYGNWSVVSGSKMIIFDVLEILNLKEENALNIDTPVERFSDKVILKDIYFGYEDAKSKVINGIDLTIYKGQTIGIIGETGSGKSTLVDLFLGLLEPTSGDIIVDGKSIVESQYNKVNWQRQLVHVPQDIFLSDITIKENIAFGVSTDKIDAYKIKEACAQAQLLDFVNSLPDGYDTVIGERGTKLSGGQRQRIGIARALYKGAEIIILDEATSALDSDTEEKIMSTVNNINNAPTVVIIAHRLSTLKNCNLIVKISNGIISWTGNYKELSI